MATKTFDVKWGIVSTIKAPAEAILNFSAHHLEAGAHRLLIYLDAPCPEARPFLIAHPKIRVFDCDDGFWAKHRPKGGKPKKVEVRQSLNATHAYRRQSDDLAWLAHIDVDEFLWANAPIGEILTSVPAASNWARTRPIEMLSKDSTSGFDKIAFKAFIPAGPDRSKIVERLYPRFGDYLKGGFLSHVAGKLFIRTGLAGARLRIHNVFQKNKVVSGGHELPEIDLCHLHATTWEDWQSHFRFRLEHGSYREDLKPARPREMGGITLHELLSAIETEQGIRGLQDFFDEVCHDTPELRQRLEREGLLRVYQLNLDAKRRKHFPGFG